MTTALQRARNLAASMGDKSIEYIRASLLDGFSWELVEQVCNEIQQTRKDTTHD